MDEPEEYVDFMAKYRDWISIKRIGIRPDTRPEEVVQHLSVIRGVVDSKSYALLGIKTSILDKCADSICAGSRKSYESLSAAVAKLGGAEARRAVAESCAKELSPLADIYLLGSVLNKMGYDCAINPKVMSKIYPDLKPPKMPLGRGKGKKSEEE